MFKYLSKRKAKVIYCLKFILECKTIVFDIDETLVFATTNRSEIKQVDEAIMIKMTKFGGMVRAFLSYRPYLIRMLDSLHENFELILYTCGTA